MTTSDLYHDFWKGFVDYCQNRQSRLGDRKPSRRHYFTIPVGRTNFTISVTASLRKHRLGCEIYISGPKANEAFEMLTDSRDAIDQQIRGLEWQPLKKKQDCRIVLYQDGFDIYDSDRDGTYAWLRAKAELFHHTFSPLIRDLPL